MRLVRIIGSVAIFAINALWLMARLAMDWIGRSTIPDDYDLLIDRLPAYAGWLFQTPGWVPGVIAALSFAYFVYVTWPAKPAALTVAQARAPIAAPSEQIVRVINSTTQLDSRLINLPSDEDIQFDCSEGNNFLYRTQDKRVVLKPPTNPQEGVYRLYVLEGTDKSTSMFGVAKGIRWSGWAKGRPRRDDLAIYEFNIVKGKGSHRVFGRPIYASYPREETITFSASEFRPVPNETWTQPRVLGSLHAGTEVLSIGPKAARSARLTMNFFPEWAGGRFRFRVRFHPGLGRDEGAHVPFKLKLPAISEFYGAAPMDSQGTSAGRRLVISEWSEFSKELYSAGPITLELFTDDASEKETFVYAVEIEIKIPSLITDTDV